MTEEQKIDRAYIAGYEQASREWSASISESGRISEDNLKTRYDALAQVRKRLTSVSA